jgi:hypothetical protein
VALGPGSIAFTGFNSDGPDNLAFVALDPIAAGSEIHFTNLGWTGAGFASGTSMFTWTATSDIVPEQSSGSTS